MCLTQLESQVKKHTPAVNRFIFFLKHDSIIPLLDVARDNVELTEPPPSDLQRQLNTSIPTMIG